METHYTYTTRGLIKEYLYRRRSGFHKKYGGRVRGLLAIVKSLFQRNT